MCAECLRLFNAGLTVKPRRAVIVHHIRPISEAPEQALVIENLESLCFKHHEQRHPERRQRDSGEAERYESDNKPRVIKV